MLSMSGTRAQLWVTVIAAVGVGSIMAAAVGWMSSKAVAISNHRQNWINALRDDLVAFFKGIDEMNHIVPALFDSRDDNAVFEEKKHEARIAALMVYRRLLLLLNIDDPLHNALIEKLNALLTIEGVVEDSHRIDAAIETARRVLKHEWEKTKYGMLARPITLAKKMWRQLELAVGGSRSPKRC